MTPRVLRTYVCRTSTLHPACPLHPAVPNARTYSNEAAPAPPFLPRTIQSRHKYHYHQPGWWPLLPLELVVAGKYFKISMYVRKYLPSSPRGLFSSPRAPGEVHSPNLSPLQHSWETSGKISGSVLAVSGALLNRKDP